MVQTQPAATGAGPTLAAQPATSERPAETGQRPWLTLLVVCTGTLMVILDQTIVNVALPSIRSDLGFSQPNLAWVINSYLIAFGGLLLLAGRLGDLIGRKRIFVSGLMLFTAASVLCGVAQSQTMLIGARFVQGIGGALIAAVSLGMIVAMFPERGEQAKGIGVFSFVQAGGASLGLLAGGVLTQAMSWRWIFFVNLPIGLIAAFVATKRLDDDKGLGLRRGADAGGALLLVSALMLGVYTIVQASDRGWASTSTVGLGALALALLAVFVLREMHAATPLVPLAIFRSRTVSAANLIQALTVTGLFGMFFLGALYLQGPLDFDPVEVGLAFLPVALAIGIFSLGVSPRLMVRFGAKSTLVPGLFLIVTGLSLLQRTQVDASYPTDIFPAMLLLGTGAGLAIPSVMTLAMSAATSSDSGLASGLVNTSQQLGGALGLAVLTTLSARRSDSLLARGASEAAAFTGGYNLAVSVGAGIVAAAIVLAFVWLPRSRPQREA